MFEGGLRGFIDDVVNTVRCIGADTAYKKNQFRRMYYQQFSEENEKESNAEASGIQEQNEKMEK